MSNHRRNGFTLIECLAYVAMLVVVLAVTMRGFYRCWDNCRAVRRNADEIISVLHVGERWRADLRGTRGLVYLTNNAGIEELHIPSDGGEIVYMNLGGVIYRQTSIPPAINLLFQNARSSEMQSTVTGQVTAWKWELELKPAQKQIKVRPLFTFEAVAGAAKNP